MLEAADTHRLLYCQFPLPSRFDIHRCEPALESGRYGLLSVNVGRYKRRHQLAHWCAFGSVGGYEECGLHWNWSSAKVRPRFEAGAGGEFGDGVVDRGVVEVA